MLTKPISSDTGGSHGAFNFLRYDMICAQQYYKFIKQKEKKQTFNMSMIV